MLQNEVAHYVPGAVREGGIAALEAIGDFGRPFKLARVGHEALAHMPAARRDNG
jgi:hypothetical protein